jgi:hypothetical protein
MPSGVAASDYQCLDFDEGPFPPAGWTQAVVAPGTLSVTNARASSSPNSLNSSCPLTMGVNGRATIDWTTTASGSAITSVSIAAAMSPVTPTFGLGWPDFVNLMCVAFTNEWSFACLAYTYGNPYMRWQSTPYTGLFMRLQYQVDDQRFTNECPVTGAFSSNVWTNAELRVTTATGNIEAIINGTTSSCPNPLMPPAPASIPFVWLGSRAIDFRTAADGDVDWTTFFDNVVVAVRR